MLHQHPNATTSALVSQDEQSCLHRLLQEKGLALRHAAYLLAGGRGDKLVDELARRLAAERVLSRTTQRRASDLLDILALEFVDDPEREEAQRFSEIDPADPVVEEICLLTDELRQVIETVGLDHPLGQQVRPAA